MWGTAFWGGGDRCAKKIISFLLFKVVWVMYFRFVFLVVYRSFLRCSPLGRHKYFFLLGLPSSNIPFFVVSSFSSKALGWCHSVSDLGLFTEVVDGMHFPFRRQIFFTWSGAQIFLLLPSLNKPFFIIPSSNTLFLRLGGFCLSLYLNNLIVELVCMYIYLLNGKGGVHEE